MQSKQEKNDRNARMQYKQKGTTNLQFLCSWSIIRSHGECELLRYKFVSLFQSSPLREILFPNIQRTSIWS